MELFLEIQPGLKVTSHQSSHDTMEVTNSKNTSSGEPGSLPGKKFPWIQPNGP